ncbi:MAG: tol-pal system protein YbgF [Acidobacteria bacterium]|nr:tol-pal system protein YbgF [Acidobacteriota bacterium]
MKLVPRRFQVPCLLAAVALGSGCLTTGGGASLQSDLDDIQQQLWRVQKDTAALHEKMDEIQTESETRPQMDPVLFPEIDAGNRMDSFQNDIQILRRRIDEMNFRMDTIVQEIRDTRTRLSVLSDGAPGESNSPIPDRPGEGGIVPGTGNGAVNPEELYQNAYADYSKGNYLLAVLGFREYVRRFPDSELADNAQYWVGESYFSSGDYEKAILAFDELVSRFPNGDRLPTAYLKKGMSYLEENRTPRGVLDLQFLVRNFPTTDEARQAREQLRRLGLAEN